MTTPSDAELEWEQTLAESNIATENATAAMTRAMKTVEEANDMQKKTDKIVAKHSRISFWTKFALVIHGIILFWATGQFLNEFKPKK